MGIRCSICETVLDNPFEIQFSLFQNGQCYKCYQQKCGEALMRLEALPKNDMSTLCSTPQSEPGIIELPPGTKFGSAYAGGGAFTTKPLKYG